MEYKTIKDNFKSEEYEISGYASVFDIVDNQNDIILKGAFKRSIEEFRNNKPKLLWQHDPLFPIGVIEEIKEDDYGLFVKCKLIPELRKVQEIFSILKHGAIEGLSIGYQVQDYFMNEEKRCISNVELLEVSIVTFPACPGAQIKEIKSLDNNQQIANMIKLITKKIETIINK